MPHLIIAGSGPLEGDLRRAARNSKFVHFLGFQNQSQMPIVYRLGDLLVLPSASETWGLVVNEAMASGRPVLISDHVGCAAEFEPAQQIAQVYPAFDGKALQRQLVKSAAAKASLGEWGRMAASFVKLWSTQSAADRLVGALQRLVPGGAPNG